MLALPFGDASFDAVTVGFGVRNVENLEAGLRELRRVLCVGGRLGILEITMPRGRLAPFYRVWFDRVVPALGKVLPGGSAYTYLPASVRRFPPPDELAALLEQSGFERVRYRTFGPVPGRRVRAPHHRRRLRDGRARLWLAAGHHRSHGDGCGV